MATSTGDVARRGTAPARDVPLTERVRRAPRGALRPRWSSRTAGVLAAGAAAAGLGDPWSLAFHAGTHGGGAYVLLYAACVAALGVPLLAAELLVGRRGRRNPVDALRAQARDAGSRAGAWGIVGWVSVAAAVLALATHAVVGGWALAFLADAVRGRLGGAGDASRIPALFGALLADPARLAAWHVAFLALAAAIASRGIGAPFERATRWIVPALLALLLALVAHAAVGTSELAHAAALLLRPDFSDLGPGAAASAVRQAVLGLGVGAGVMVAYGSHLPCDVSIPRTAVAVAAIDGAVALLAGLAVLPLLLAHGLAPAHGHGLVFVTVPVALSASASGPWVAAAFFAFVTLAALAAAVALLEPAVSVASERLRLARPRATVAVSALAWALGAVAALSPRGGAHVPLAARGAFDALSLVVWRGLLPFGAFAIACFAGCVLSRHATAAELGLGEGMRFRAWRALVRWVVPGVVAGMAAFGGWRA